MKAVILTEEDPDNLLRKIDDILSILKKKETSLLDGLIDNDQFIKLMGISRRTAQTWRDEGAITFRQYGKSIYYTQQDIEEFLDKNKKEAFK